jgi:hypothetical protein
MLPREIQCEHWPERTTFDFPVRPIGRIRYLGLLPVGIAILIASLPARQVWQSVSGVLEGRAHPGDLIFSAFLLLFIMAAMTPFSLGLFILAGRTRIIAKRDRVTVTEIAGPVRWSRRIPVSNVERLEFAEASNIQPALENESALAISKLGALVAILKNGRKKLLLLGYPGEWIEGMAEELSSLMRLDGAPVRVEKQPPLNARNDVIQPKENLPQPSGSKARLNEGIGAMEVMIPARGLRSGSFGLFFFGIIWCLFMAFFTWGMLFHHHSSGRNMAYSTMMLFVMGFWVIGAGLISMGLHLGTRKWTLTVRHDQFEAESRSVLRSRQWRWDTSDLRDLCVGNSGIEVNNVPLREVQVLCKSGKKTGLLRGCPEDELQWLASTLRRNLHLSSSVASESIR